MAHQQISKATKQNKKRSRGGMDDLEVAILSKILSLSYSSCKNRANPHTPPRHRCTPLVDAVDKPDGKKTPLSSSAAPATTSSSSRHDTKRYFCAEHALELIQIGRGLRRDPPFLDTPTLHVTP